MSYHVLALGVSSKWIVHEQSYIDNSIDLNVTKKSNDLANLK